jgi:3-oxoacyl-[acyl-carrier-protein] synthase-1
MTETPKAVILEQGEILCGLGALEETVTDLFENECAIVPGPCFGVDVRFAPFKDVSWRGLPAAAGRLASAIDLALLDKDKTVFLFCAAKGDLSPLEEYCTSGKKPGANAFLPLLSSQAASVRTTCSIPACRTIVVSNACASGAIGVEVAAELLLCGRFENAVLFGFDSVSRFVATGFHALSALSPLGARPFDAHRDGLTLGEGACIAVMTYRKAFRDDIVVAGAGSSNDANHRTGPSRTGDGLLRAARAALHDAGMPPSAIGAVKCHGTATNYNDAMEAKAIFGLFGEKIPPCFSIKGAIGHTSGAGSLLEICVAAECLRRRRIPPTCGYSVHGVDEPVAVSASAQQLSQQSILCLSAGFGGINAAVVLREHDV